MDIFKKLTKGITFDPKNGTVPQQLQQKERSSLAGTKEKKDSVAVTTLPVELDFFAEKTTTTAATAAEVKKNTSTINSVTSTNTPVKNNTLFKASFKSQEDFEAFKAEHGIRLALHQTSENSSSSSCEGSTAGLLHLTSLDDKEQVAPVQSFKELVEFYKLDSRLLKRIEHLALEEEEKKAILLEKRSELLLPSNEAESSTLVINPTAVQMQATPVLLQGRDMIVMAPTGSGKTLAFILGIFGRLLLNKENKSGTVQALVISPTRELADQIHEQFMKFSPRDEHGKVLLRVGHLNKAVVNGWTAQRPNSYPHVLISTPLRLIHALRSDLLSIEHLQMLILDEADRLLADGFDEQLDELLVAMKNPAKIQKALFSATMPSGVEATARTILSAPYRIVCGASANSNGSTLQAIYQKLIFCGNGQGTSLSKNKKRKPDNDNDNDHIKHDESVGKLMALRQLIYQGSLTPPVLIFVGSSVRAERLFSDLVQWSSAALNRPLPVDYLHSGRPQSERSSVLEAFRSGKIWFLITTDVLARGLDFPPLSAVINYDFPDSTAAYIHRIGRTGRAGRKGTAYTLYTSDDLPELRIVVNVMRESGLPVQQWLQDHYTKSQGPSRLSKKLKHQHKKEKEAKEAKEAKA